MRTSPPRSGHANVALDSRRVSGGFSASSTTGKEWALLARAPPRTHGRRSSAQGTPADGGAGLDYGETRAATLRPGAPASATAYWDCLPPPGAPGHPAPEPGGLTDSRGSQDCLPRWRAEPDADSVR